MTKLRDGFVEDSLSLTNDEVIDLMVDLSKQLDGCNDDRERAFVSFLVAAYAQLVRSNKQVASEQSYHDEMVEAAKDFARSAIEESGADEEPIESDLVDATIGGAVMYMTKEVRNAWNLLPVKNRTVIAKQAVKDVI